MSESPKTNKSRRSPLKSQRLNKPSVSSAKIRKVVSLGFQNKKQNEELRKSPSIISRPETPLRIELPTEKDSNDAKSETVAPISIPTPIPQESEQPPPPQQANLATVSSVVRSEVSGKSDNSKNTKYSSVKEHNPINMIRIAASLRKELHELSGRELMELAIYILQKDPEERTKKDLVILTKSMASVDYFQQYDETTVQECLKKMSYVYHPKNSTVFEIDSVGTNFWVILEGSVGVNVWTTFKTAAGLEDKRLEEKTNQEQPQSDAKKLVTLLSLKKKIFKASCVKRFGGKFQPNIIHIVRKEAEKLEAELNFLASLPLFKDWTHKALKSILYLAPIEKFQRGHFVYKEGDPCEKMYIVKKGEFRVLKHIEIKIEKDPAWKNDIQSIRRQSVVKKSIELGLLGEGQLFGEEDLLRDGERNITIVCNSKEAEVYAIEKRNAVSRIVKWEQSSANWLKKNIKWKMQYYQEKIKSRNDTVTKNKEFLMFEKSDHEIDRLRVHITRRPTLVDQIPEIREQTLLSKFLANRKPSLPPPQTSVPTDPSPKKPETDEFQKKRLSIFHGELEKYRKAPRVYRRKSSETVVSSGSAILRSDFSTMLNIKFNNFKQRSSTQAVLVQTLRSESSPRSPLRETSSPLNVSQTTRLRLEHYIPGQDSLNSLDDTMDLDDTKKATMHEQAGSPPGSNAVSKAQSRLLTGSFTNVRSIEKLPLTNREHSPEGSPPVIRVESASGGGGKIASLKTSGHRASSAGKIRVSRLVNKEQNMSNLELLNLKKESSSNQPQPIHNGSTNGGKNTSPNRPPRKDGTIKIARNLFKMLNVPKQNPQEEFKNIHMERKRSLEVLKVQNAFEKACIRLQNQKLAELMRNKSLERNSSHAYLKRDFTNFETEQLSKIQSSRDKYTNFENPPQISSRLTTRLSSRDMNRNKPSPENFKRYL